MNDNTVMPATNDARKGDVVAPTKEKGWFYTDTVKDHFFTPRIFWRMKLVMAMRILVWSVLRLVATR